MLTVQSNISLEVGQVHPFHVTLSIAFDDPDFKKHIQSLVKDNSRFVFNVQTDGFFNAFRSLGKKKISFNIGTYNAPPDGTFVFLEDLVNSDEKPVVFQFDHESHAEQFVREIKSYLEDFFSDEYKDFRKLISSKYYKPPGAV